MFDKLVKAISKGNVEEAQSLISIVSNTDLVNNENEQSWSILHWAVSCKEHIIVKKLLDKCPELIKKVNYDGITPLHTAAALADSEMVEIVIEADPKMINTKDKSNWTALHYAFFNPHDEDLNISSNARSKVIDLLLKYNPELLFDVNNNKQTPLHLTYLQDQNKIIKLLENNPKLLSFIDDKEQTIAHIAIKNNHLELIRWLFEHNDSLFQHTNDKEETILHYAIDHDSRDETVRLLFDLLPKLINIPDKVGCTILHRTISNGRDELSKQLIKSMNSESINLYSEQISNFNIYEEFEDPDVIASHIEDHNEDKNDILKDIVKDLTPGQLEFYNEARLSLQNKFFSYHANTKLNKAVIKFADNQKHLSSVIKQIIFQDQEAISRMLISEDIEVITTDNKPEKIIETTSSDSNRFINIIDLDMSDFDLNSAQYRQGTSSNTGGTPLHWALVENQTDIALLLVSRMNYKSLNTQNESNESAMSLAVKYKQKDIINVLLKYGADVIENIDEIKLSPIFKEYSDNFINKLVVSDFLLKIKDVEEEQLLPIKDVLAKQSLNQDEREILHDRCIATTLNNVTNNLDNIQNFQIFITSLVNKINIIKEAIGLDKDNNIPTLKFLAAHKVSIFTEGELVNQYAKFEPNLDVRECVNSIKLFFKENIENNYCNKSSLMYEEIKNLINLENLISYSNHEADDQIKTMGDTIHDTD